MDKRDKSSMLYMRDIIRFYQRLKSSLYMNIWLILIKWGIKHILNIWDRLLIHFLKKDIHKKKTH